MPTTLTNGIQLPDKGSVDWYSSMQSNYNLIDTHLGDTDVHVTAEDKANWNSKQGSLSQAQLDAIAQVSTNTSDIASLQSDKANTSHTHSSSDITDIGDYATKQYVDNSISGLVDNAPAALDTLKELSTALNDDANFASTVTTALGAKANSADLATVATSGDYNDLDNLPTIPTKTSDLSNDSDFVVSSSLATVATSGDYDDLSNKPSIPTNTSDLNNDSGFVTLNDFDIPSKTSDLTNDSGFITSSDVPTSTSDLNNDSNFVDTSNSAVSSGITSAKVTSYDAHIADNDIHVTTADKTKWNNGVSQAFVFRYSSTTLVASSTNSNTLLDNTDNLKVGDKVIDSNGVLFSITAIDTQNSTFTIGTALIDLAQDSDVVHKSGNETISGELTLSDTLNSSDIVPIANNSYSSGSSNNQWNNLYAKNYYYNGVAWGLDKANGWTNDNTFKGIYQNQGDTNYIIPRGTNTVKGDLTTSGFFSLIFKDKNNGNLATSGIGYLTFGQNSSGAYANIGVETIGSTDNARHTNSISLKIDPITNDNTAQFYPVNNNATDLGTSTNKWKSFNGLTPSSLGLPSDRSARIDISSYFTNTGTGNTNDYSVPANGFIFLNLLNAFAVICYSIDGTNNVNYAQSYFRQVDGQIYILFPVRKNDTFRTLWTSNGGTITVTNAYFIPCQGNV